MIDDETDGGFSGNQTWWWMLLNRPFLPQEKRKAKVYRQKRGSRYMASMVVHQGWRVSQRDSLDFLLAHSLVRCPQIVRPLPELSLDRQL